MPKPPKKSATEENLEFQKKEFPAKIAVARKKANAALAAEKKLGSKRSLSVEERGRHQRVLKAAARVEGRLSGKAPSRKDVTKPGKSKGKPKSTPESRQRATEKATGTSGIIDPLREISALATAGQKKRGR